MDVVSSNPSASSSGQPPHSQSQVDAYFQQQQYRRQQQLQQQQQARSRRVSTYDLTGQSPMVTTTNVAPSPRSSSRRSKIHSSPRSRVSSSSNSNNGMLPTTGHDASFPVRLHQLLNSADSRIIRWQPRNEGKSFTILNGAAFEREVLPRLYRNANVERFGQLLSLYGFQRVENGPFKGDYYHTMFIKDKPHLTHMIRKVSGAPRSPGSPHASNSPLQGQGATMAFKHSLATSMRATVTSRLGGLPFCGKLHYLLSNGVYDLGYERVMSWQAGGHSFAVHSSEDFEMEGLAAMLGTPGHASFRAQLSLHGFQRVRSDGGDHVEAYYHPDFVREQPQLCRLIRSRSHAKSSMIHHRGTPTNSPSGHHHGHGHHGSRSVPSTPKTPTTREHIVSPMSGIMSTKAKADMIENNDRVPESLFLDTPGYVIATPSQDVLPRSSIVGTNNNNKSNSNTAEDHDSEEDSADVVNQNDTANTKVRKRARVGHMMPQNYFPFKLHCLMNLSEKFGFQNILCWAPHGRCFLIMDKDLFGTEVLPLFRHSEFASFRAQLKAYGFVRIATPGPDKGAYYHPSFLRGRPELCATITRRPKNVNGTVRGRPKGQKDPEPDFYRMKFLPDLDVEEVTPPSGSTIKDVLEEALTQMTPPAVVTRDLSSGNDTTGELTKQNWPGAIGVEDAIRNEIAMRNQRRTSGAVKKEDTRTFPVKLHTLLNDVHEQVNRFVLWNEKGDSFSISDEKRFEEIGCVKYLKIPTLEAFKREVEAHGFQRKESGEYYHAMFHKALPHLSLCIKRDGRLLSKASSDSDDVSSGGSYHSSSNSSVGSSQQVPASVAVSKEDRATPPMEITRRKSSFSTISAASPEMEVAMALTAMEHDNRGCVLSKNSTKVVPVSPMDSDVSHSSETPSLAPGSPQQSTSSPTPAVVTTVRELPPIKKPVETEAAEVPTRRQRSDPPGRFDVEEAQKEQNKAEEKELLKQQNQVSVVPVAQTDNAPMEEVQHVATVEESDVEVVDVTQTHTENGPAQEESPSSPVEAEQPLVAPPACASESNTAMEVTVADEPAMVVEAKDETVATPTNLEASMPPTLPTAAATPTGSEGEPMIESDSVMEV